MEEENVEKDMTPILIKDLGSIFFKEDSKNKRRCGIYLCLYCNKEFKAMNHHITHGNMKSCGCHRYKHKHNLRNTKIYNVWDAMKQRCNNKNHKSFKNYGGRDISVCSEWQDNFMSFYNWSVLNGYQEGLTLDRIDNNGNYEPDNCRWTTQSIQMCNTRDICPTNTSGFRGVCWNKRENKWMAYIDVNKKRIHLGYHQTALEGAKAYETYVRLNNLEHNFTPALTEEEIKELNLQILKEMREAI